MIEPNIPDELITAYTPEVKPKEAWLTLVDWKRSKKFWTDKIAELQAENEIMRAERKTVHSRVCLANNETDKMRGENSKLQAEVEKLTEELRTQTAAMESQGKVLRKVSEELEEAYNAGLAAGEKNGITDLRNVLTDEAEDLTVKRWITRKAQELTNC